MSRSEAGLVAGFGKAALPINGFKATLTAAWFRFSSANNSFLGTATNVRPESLAVSWIPPALLLDNLLQ